MKASISNIGKKRGRGRPKVGAVPVMVRLLPGQATSVDAWRGRQTDRPGRPEAIRRLVERALGAEPPAPRARSKGAPKAAEMASHEINKLGDKSATDEERATRKRRLISGPKEFRGMRRGSGQFE